MVFPFSSQKVEENGERERLLENGDRSSSASDRPLAPEIDEHEHLSTAAGNNLRAFLLGCNDGLVSVASLMLGVDHGGDVGEEDDYDRRMHIVAAAGLASLIAGMFSMGTGEYVSVAGQKDQQFAEISKERAMQEAGPEAREHELEELTQILQGRGLSYQTARKAAEEMTEYDAVGAHAREELGIDINDVPSPVQAAVTSMLSFLVGGIGPLLVGAFVQNSTYRPLAVFLTTMFLLALSGYVGAHTGGSCKVSGTMRVLVGGTAAMIITYLCGALYNHYVISH
eukprot:Clim_evm13s78 gene=Clim_evmTU13s78